MGRKVERSSLVTVAVRFVSLKVPSCRGLVAGRARLATVTLETVVSFARAIIARQSSARCDARRTDSCRVPCVGRSYYRAGRTGESKQASKQAHIPMPFSQPKLLFNPLRCDASGHPASLRAAS